MKLDKETFIKEHFWFLLGLFVVLVLISLVLLWTTTSSATAAHEKVFTSTMKELQAIPSSTPKNDEWIKALDAKTIIVKQQKDKIWAEAWKKQQEFMQWPEQVQPDHRTALNAMRFGQEIPREIRAAYEKIDQHEVYEKAVEVVQPEVVQFKVNWEGMLRWQSGKEAWPTIRPPTFEDMWLAQEDLWVQSELLRIVRTANDGLAQMKPEAPARKKTVSNGDWLLDLELVEVMVDQRNRTGLSFQLTNIGNRRQLLGVPFAISFANNREPYRLEISGEPLAPGAATKPQQKALDVQYGNPTSIGKVTQLFDWRTVPVKRIDRIALGYNSSRTAQSALKVPSFSPQEQAQATDPTAGDGRVGPARQTRPVPGPAAGPGGPSDPSETENKVVRKRYVEVSPEVRRMPFGMVLIVDQAHIQDVLAAFVNSPLRIQMTEWHWRRCHEDIKPRETDQPAPLEGRPAPAADSPRFVRPRPISQNIPGQPIPGTVPNSEEHEWDLVELAVYGIASLYERFPPPDPNAGKAADATAAKPPVTK
jgi:hypothetical protein